MKRFLIAVSVLLMAALPGYGSGIIGGGGGGSLTGAYSGGAGITISGEGTITTDDSVVKTNSTDVINLVNGTVNTAQVAKAALKAASLSPGTDSNTLANAVQNNSSGAILRGLGIGQSYALEGSGPDASEIDTDNTFIFHQTLWTNGLVLWAEGNQFPITFSNFTSVTIPANVPFSAMGGTVGNAQYAGQATNTEKVLNILDFGGHPTNGLFAGVADSTTALSNVVATAAASNAVAFIPDGMYFDVSSNAIWTAVTNISIRIGRHAGLFQSTHVVPGNGSRFSGLLTFANCQHVKIQGQGDGLSILSSLYAMNAANSGTGNVGILSVNPITNRDFEVSGVTISNFHFGVALDGERIKIHDNTFVANGHVNVSPSSDPANDGGNLEINGKDWSVYFNTFASSNALYAIEDWHTQTYPTNSSILIAFNHISGAWTAFSHTSDAVLTDYAIERLQIIGNTFTALPGERNDAQNGAGNCLQLYSNAIHVDALISGNTFDLRTNYYQNVLNLQDLSAKTNSHFTIVGNIATTANGQNMIGNCGLTNFTIANNDFPMPWYFVASSSSKTLTNFTTSPTIDTLNFLDGTTLSSVPQGITNGYTTAFTNNGPTVLNGPAFMKGVQWAVNVITNTGTISTSLHTNGVCLVDPTVGAQNITVTLSYAAGYDFSIIKTDSSPYTVTIDSGSASKLIDGLSRSVVLSNYCAVRIISDGVGLCRLTTMGGTVLPSLTMRGPIYTVTNTSSLIVWPNLPVLTNGLPSNALYKTNEADGVHVMMMP